MFKLADPKQTYRYPVTINVPVGEGKVEPGEFTAEFRLLPADEVDNNALENDLKYVEAVLFGWDGIADHTGKPLKFNATNRDRLAKIGYFVMGISQAYRNFSIGLPAKNSNESSIT